MLWFLLLRCPPCLVTGLRTVFQLAHHCVWFISMRSSSWMGVTGKTIQHKFNFYSILGETFGLWRHVASDKTASHKSVINFINHMFFWDCNRLCSEMFWGIVPTALRKWASWDIPSRSWKNPSRNRLQTHQRRQKRLEFFSANTTDWRRMALKKLWQIITPFFRHLLSLSEQLLYFFIFF